MASALDFNPILQGLEMQRQRSLQEQQLKSQQAAQEQQFGLQERQLGLQEQQFQAGAASRRADARLKELQIRKIENEMKQSGMDEEQARAFISVMELPEEASPLIRGAKMKAALDIGRLFGDLKKMKIEAAKAGKDDQEFKEMSKSLIGEANGLVREQASLLSAANNAYKLGDVTEGDRLTQEANQKRRQADQIRQQVARIRRGLDVGEAPVDNSAQDANAEKVDSLVGDADEDVLGPLQRLQQVIRSRRGQ